MIWSKAFVMERERFDGADVAHLILRACGRQLDWARLLAPLRTATGACCCSHLVLFGFIYPVRARRASPAAVLRELLSSGSSAERPRSSPDRVCQGTLISRAQYLVDVERWDYADPPAGAARQHDAAPRRAVDGGHRRRRAGRHAGAVVDQSRAA